jgi:hypothetical protein
MAVAAARSSIAIARGYPKVTVDGIDLDPSDPLLERLKARAAADPAEGVPSVEPLGAVEVVAAGLGVGLTKNAWYAYNTRKDKKIAIRTRRSMPSPQ